MIRCHGCGVERHERPLPLTCPDCDEFLPEVIFVPRSFGDYLRRQYPHVMTAFEDRNSEGRGLVLARVGVPFTGTES